MTKTAKSMSAASTELSQASEQPSAEELETARELVRQALTG